LKPLYPPLLDPTTLPRRALVVAPHADDEVFGCGGVLACHAERGDPVRIVIASDGAAGDPRKLESDLARVRIAESKAAGAVLGVHDYRFLGLPDGALSGVADLSARLARELEEFAPEVVYGPAPEEFHPDHRALSRALVEAWRTLARRGWTRGRRLLLYGVNCQNRVNLLIETTRYWPKKRAAIECFKSQLAYHDLVGKTKAVDTGRIVNCEDPKVENAEGFAEIAAEQLDAYEGAVGDLLDVLWGAGAADLASTGGMSAESRGRTAGALSVESSARAAAVLEPEWAATAVICTWNKKDVLRDNLLSLRRQRRGFAAIVVVDNASTDGTGEMVGAEFPEVRLIRMPHSKYGACETFNIGFASATTPLVAILDDDIELPEDWLEKTVARMQREPATTAIVSTKVVEPGMPDSYVNSPAVNRERYMSTFRGCGSLARASALREAGGYDEYLFIYGNERDLTCRLLNLGYRVLQYPEVVTHHKNPFGVRMGQRSLYYHARNAWITQLKYAPLEDLFRMPFLVVSKVLLRERSSEERGEISDATGTIGIGKSLRETPGAAWVLVKAAFGVLAALPHCLRHRAPCTASDYELPIA